MENVHERSSASAPVIGRQMEGTAGERGREENNTNKVDWD
jgi:hypothetical protein